MMHRKTLLVGNWKMHLNVHQSSVLAARLQQAIKRERDIEVVLAPSMLALQPLSVQLDRSKFRLSAQNVNATDEGAFTGEVSAAMLRGLVHYAIVGHSERRLYFHETLEVVRDKVAACVRNEIIPIICVGETKHERTARETKRVLHDQVTTALANVTSSEIANVVIAYEPLWAISTFGGELAKPQDVAAAIAHIREQVRALYGPAAAQAIRVLYGGSVDDQIVSGYLQVVGCDGALVGGASLNYHKFAGIVAAASRVAHQRTKEKA